MLPSSTASSRRTLLVTGASSGIGRAVAAEFAGKGWRVLGTSRTPESIPQQRRVPGVEYLAMEQSDLASVLACAKEAGPVDALVNNAGQSQGGALEELPTEELEALFRINVFGPVALTRAMLPAMRERGGGAVVFVGSLMADFPVPFQGSYAASKMALRGFVTALRSEVAPFGITATVVQPGYYRSDIDGRRPWHGEPDSPYATRRGQVVTAVAANHGAARDPAEVARRIWRLVHAARPPVISSVGSNGPLLRTVRRLMPDAVAERIVAGRFGL